MLVSVAGQLVRALELGSHLVLREVRDVIFTFVYPRFRRAALHFNVGREPDFRSEGADIVVRAVHILHVVDGAFFHHLLPDFGQSRDDALDQPLVHLRRREAACVGVRRVHAMVAGQERCADEVNLRALACVCGQLIGAEVTHFPAIGFQRPQRHLAAYRVAQIAAPESAEMDDALGIVGEAARVALGRTEDQRLAGYGVNELGQLRVADFHRGRLGGVDLQIPASCLMTQDDQFAVGGRSCAERVGRPLDGETVDVLDLEAHESIVLHAGEQAGVRSGLAEGRVHHQRPRVGDAVLKKLDAGVEIGFAVERHFGCQIGMRDIGELRLIAHLDQDAVFRLKVVLCLVIPLDGVHLHIGQCFGVRADSRQFAALPDGLHVDVAVNKARGLVPVLELVIDRHAFLISTGGQSLVVYCIGRIGVVCFLVDDVQVIHPADVIHAGRFAELRGQDSGRNDVGQHAVPAGVGVYRGNAALSGRSGDRAGLNGIGAILVSVDIDLIELGAVPVVEGDEILLYQRVVGEHNVAPCRAVSVQLALTHDGRVDLAGQDRLFEIVVALVKTLQANQSVQQIGILQNPVDAENTDSGNARCSLDDAQHVQHRAFLDAQGAKITIAGDREVGQLLQGDGRKAGNCRDMRRSDLAASREGYAGNAAVRCFQRDKCAAAGQVEGDGHVRASADVQRFQQSVVAKADGRGVGIAVAGRAVAEFQPAQLDRAGNVEIADVQRCQIADVRNVGSAVQIDFRIVQGVDGAFQLVGLVAFGADAGFTGTGFKVDVHVRVRRDGDLAAGRNASPILRRVCAEGDGIGRGNRSVVLAGAVLFLIGFVLRALVFLGSVHHFQIRDGSVIGEGPDVLFPHILNDEGFRSCALVRLELGENALCIPRAIGFQRGEQGLAGIEHQVADIAPDDGIGGVENVLRTDSVRVLHAVGEGQATFVVVAVAGVVVIVLRKIPVYAVISRDEHVFGAVIDHAVTLGEQVVIDQRIVDEVVAVLIEPLRSAVLSRVMRVGGFAVGHAVFKLRVGRRRAVGGNYPAQKALECDLVGVGRFIRVAELKAALAIPRFIVKVGILEKTLVVGVVADLNTALKRVIRRIMALSEHVQILLAVVHIAAAKQRRAASRNADRTHLHRFAAGVVEEYDTGMALNRVAHLGIGGSGRVDVRLIGVVLVRQHNVIGVLRRSDVQLDIEIIDADAVLRHAVYFGSRTVTEG